MQLPEKNEQGENKIQEQQMQNHFSQMDGHAVAVVCK